MKTRAAVLDSVGGPITVRSLTLQSPRAGEVMIKVHAAGICRSDWQVCTGTTPHPLPVVLGHEGAGTVVEAGPDVAHVRPGDEVILSWAPGCDACFYCVRGRPALCEIFDRTLWEGVMADGTPRFFQGNTPLYQYCALGCFAEHVVVAAAACVPLPQGVPMSVAALIGCCVTTGVGAVLNTARVPEGSSVAIFGAGGVGLSMILGAYSVHAGCIIAIDKLQERADLVTALGATHFLLSSPNVVEKIQGLTNGRGADFVFDATGIPVVQTTCLEATRPGGTVVLSGLAPVGSDTNLPGAIITRKEKIIKGSYYGSAVPHRDFVQYAQWYRDGTLNLDPMLSRTYELSEVRTAYRDLNEGRIVRGVLSLGSTKNNDLL